MIERLENCAVFLLLVKRLLLHDIHQALAGRPIQLTSSHERVLSRAIQPQQASHTTHMVGVSTIRRQQIRHITYMVPVVRIPNHRFKAPIRKLHRGIVKTIPKSTSDVLIIDRSVLIHHIDQTFSTSYAPQSAQFIRHYHIATESI